MKNKYKYKISVIMGIYNCAPYLQEALDSLYVQTFQDFEIILCEDGSKDNTYEIAKKNADSHSNIKLLRNEKNLGLNATLNKCLQEAEGEYIARMDGDDISLPTRFEIEVRFLDEHPEYAIVSTSMSYFDDDGVFKVGQAVGEPQKEDFIKGTPFCHAPCMVRKEAYEAVGGYSVSEHLLRVEDYHLWMKMYLKGYRGYRINEPLYSMRDDRNAIHRRNWKCRRNEAHIKYLIWKNFNLPVYNLIYCLRPLFLTLLPAKIYMLLHKN